MIAAHNISVTRFSSLVFWNFYILYFDKCKLLWCITYIFLSASKGCGRPRITDEWNEDTHVLYYVGLLFYVGLDKGEVITEWIE